VTLRALADLDKRVSLRWWSPPPPSRVHQRVASRTVEKGLPARLAELGLTSALDFA
jgi:hypothetical protein